ncbi:hypothetical protein RJT34_18871 [Clitoria ternatea]|uniref:Uncharacterized protein n=1 Tax=Clitoria ternatea TaxID=43366 RepID=A0AAN9IQ95_CLITE
MWAFLFSFFSLSLSPSTKSKLFDLWNYSCSYLVQHRLLNLLILFFLFYLFYYFLFFFINDKKVQIFGLLLIPICNLCSGSMWSRSLEVRASIRGLG